MKISIINNDDYKHHVFSGWACLAVGILTYFKPVFIILLMSVYFETVKIKIER